MNQKSGLSRRQDFSPLFNAGDFFSMSPFSLMRRISDDMERAFSEAMESRGGAGGRPGASWIPPIDVRRHEGNLIVCAELPGLTREDVKVEITDEGLVLQGERRQESTSDQQGYQRTERRYGSFYRLIPLPENVNPEQAQANFKNGVLEITIPLPEPPQPKRREVPIQSASDEPQSAAQGGSQSGNT